MARARGDDKGRFAFRFFGRSLTAKITVLFITLLCLSLCLAYILFLTSYERQRYSDYERMVHQNAEIIAVSIDAMIVNTSYSSKMLLSNETIQNMLIQHADFSTPGSMKTLSALLNSAAYLQPHVAGLYLFDTNGQKIGVDNYTLRQFSFDRVENSWWYDRVFDQRGYYTLLLNAGETRPLYGDENVISLVRSIYNLNAQSDLLGTLMINMRESFLTNCFRAVTSSSSLRITVVDEQGAPLLRSVSSDFYDELGDENRASLLEGKGTTMLQTTGAETLMYSSAPTKNAKWFVITATAIQPGIVGTGGIWSLLWITLLIIALVVMASTFIILHMVTRPLHHLTTAMVVPSGAYPKRIDIPTADDEIGQLKSTYNDMVDQIEKLIENIEEESARKRQAELNALQAQINPHFLYNTIDTARALAITGDGEGVSRLLRALGAFYRNSINSGDEIIAVDREIDMVKAYLSIQKIRYADIEVAFDTDPAVDNLLIPKLILQPLVENALYHGLRPNGNRGLITVKTHADKHDAILSVIDNGVGISDEAIAQALSTEKNEDSGFGLKGTIERLRLFYEDAVSVQIGRAPEGGTFIHLTIDRRKVEP